MPGTSGTGTDRFSVVVVGSGFGGSIAALSFGKLFAATNQGKPQPEWDQVCILERGQWWLSHEIPTTPKAVRQAMANPPKPNMREWLEDRGEPFGTWAHPDNEKGLTRLITMARQINRRGLYDVRVLAGNVRVICASGVGGGSLVYSNVTVRPPPSIWAGWPTERDGSPPLANYFPLAETFIGTNPITTIAGLSGQKLERSKVFEEAVNKLSSPHVHIVNERDVNGQLKVAVPLSITDVPADLFKNLTPDLVAKYQGPMQTNVCERQGRCNLGCLPGARHTLNKRLYQALTDKANPLPIVVEALSEAYRIEYREGEDFPYIVHYQKTQRAASGGDEIDPNHAVRAKTLIVAAGTLGTNELLARSGREGLRLSPALGRGFSPNGDLLGYVRMKDRRIDITRGPINTSHAMFGTPERPFAGTIEDTAMSTMVAPPVATFFELDDLASRGERARRRLPFSKKLSLILRFGGLGFAALLGLSLSTLERMASRAGLGNLPTVPFLGSPQEPANDRFKRKFVVQEEDFRAPELADSKPLRIMHDLLHTLFADHEDPFASPAKRLESFFVFSGMGVDGATGALSLNGEQLQVDWKAEDNEKAYADVIEAMQGLANVISPGSTLRTLDWSRSRGGNRAVEVLHPLGGCRMGDDGQQGVVNGHGQVFLPDAGGPSQVYPGFYVMDGSVIPGALGVNSSLTIAAVAFRCTEHALALELARRPPMAGMTAASFLPQ